MSVYTLISVAALLFLAELSYFKIAKAFNILDTPNHRSSHSSSTVRGGGIIFLIACLFFTIINSFEYPLFIIGLLLIGIISFLDDIYTLNNKFRLVIHVISVLLLIAELNLYNIPILWLIFIVISIIGIVNAINFMDGINGITGFYALCVMTSLFYMNDVIIQFIDPDLLSYVILALGVFLFFNFRKQASCFAGDVGSIGIAFILIFIIGKLIIKTDDYSFIMFLIVYGLDAGSTILFRVIRRENILEPHRSHFYQYLANTKKIPHLYISAGYGISQIAINFVVIYYLPKGLETTMMVVIGAFVIFTCVRLYIEGWEKLITKV